MQTTPNPTAAAGRRYAVEFTLSMVAYAVVLIISIKVIEHGLTPALKLVFALLPLIPIAFVFAAIVRYMGSIDELQRRIQIESLSLAAGITALLAITYGFLETVGLPHLSAWYTYAAVMVAWIIAQPFVARRYR
jgi:O-antigen/teichoic acid export membrane protein